MLHVTFPVSLIAMKKGGYCISNPITAFTTLLAIKIHGLAIILDWR